MPRGVTSLTVDLKYDNANRTVVDLGLRDPKGQRGWSGGNKSTFTITEFEATPSYAPGKIQAGEWRLVLGVPNIREGSSAHYEAKVTLGSGPVERKAIPSFVNRTISRKPGWQRGDFHMHTEHSDGSCDDGTGVRKPCPVWRTLVAARAPEVSLDFIAITDHNTLTQRAPMGPLQSDFPGMLLIPGTEVTTFYGHANAIGLSKPIEFQLGSERLKDVGQLADQVEAQHGFLSINHPGQPSGEVCMGCGWTAQTDWSRVNAIEIVNGSTLRTGNVEGITSGIPFWDDKLRQGFRITGIGGSDNHDPTDRTGARQSPVGRPTTVVWAQELSVRGVVEGVKAGRVFVDVSGLPAAVLDAEGTAEGQSVHMGGVLQLDPQEQGRVKVSTRETGGGVVELVSYGLMTIEPDRAQPAAVEAMVQLSPGATFGYVRPEVRDADGKLKLIGNPIYVVLKQAEAPRRR